MLALLPGVMLALGWGCAMLPPQQPTRDPFLSVEPGLAPQQRMRPVRPTSPVELTPNIEDPSRYQPTPTPRSQPTPRAVPPTAPRRQTPKTFADPEPKPRTVPPRSAAPPYRTEKQPAPVDITPDVIAPPKRRPAPPTDGPVLAPPEASPTAARQFTPASAGDEPLDLQIDVPASRPVGSGAPFQLTIRNVSDETLRNVSVVSEFDDALEYPGSDRHTVTHKIPKIEAGDAKESRLTLLSRTEGSHRCTFTVNVGSRVILVKDAAVDFVSRQIDWQLHGPSERTVGSRAEFNIPLINISRRNLRNLTVRVDLDAALTVREMTKGGRLDDRSITWTIDELAADEGLLLQLEVECREPAMHACLAATVSGPDVPSDDAEACLTVKSLNGQLDVRAQDLSDPVAVGEIAEFRVTVENPGLTAAKNISLTCHWPEGFQWESAEQIQGGQSLPLDVTREELSATLPSIARLDPDRRLEFRVRLQARQAGPHDVRFSVRDDTRPTAIDVIEPIMVHR